MPNNLEHVRQVMGLLEQHGITTWLFGGWAEELHEMAHPRPHRDVDLLYLADSFALVDQFFQLGQVQEVVAKRFTHKRAFLLDGVMTEILIVLPDLTTMFWDRTCFRWPDDTFEDPDRSLRISSLAALTRYREAHHQLRQ